MNEWPIDRLRWIFRSYADVDFPARGAHVYAAIANKLASDGEMLALAALVRQGQPPPNLLFASVHYLLLSGVEHPLAAYYPDLAMQPLDPETVYPHFRDFCVVHRERIVELIRTRLVQTNVLERCGLLLPVFAVAAEALDRTELAMVEIGASAGLNLMWDRYGYRYGDATWGDSTSSVLLETDVRGEHSLPALPKELRLVWRKGVDLSPVDLQDADAFLWQRALMWPERRDRQKRLEAARALMQHERVAIVSGDACDALPTLLRAAPLNAGLCVLASFALYQFPKKAKDRVLEILAECSRTRDVAFIRMDTKRIGDPNATITFTLFHEGALHVPRDLAHGHPHGSWIEWQRQDR